MNRDKATQLTLFLMRAVAGLILAQAGTVIVFGWFGGMPGGVKFEIMTQMGIGGVLETVGGTLVAIGLLTRPAAFIASGVMAVAYFQFHATKSPWPSQNQGGEAALLSVIFLFISVNGAGPYSLDALVAKKR